MNKLTKINWVEDLELYLWEIWLNIDDQKHVTEKIAEKGDFKWLKIEDFRKALLPILTQEFEDYEFEQFSDALSDEFFEVDNKELYGNFIKVIENSKDNYIKIYLSSNNSKKLFMLKLLKAWFNNKSSYDKIKEFVIKNSFHRAIFYEWENNSDLFNI